MSKTCMSDIGVSKTREGDLGVVNFLHMKLLFCPKKKAYALHAFY
jgi:hypothetical protein